MSPSHVSLDTYNGRQAHEDIYDLICVGFGPASLAIAVALHDLEVDARILFLERQPRFAWHAGMLIPSAKMQISFLKDLATFRDPRSHFTFLNYLKTRGRLEAFANLGTFFPLREEFNDYLTWAAEHFDDIVRYSTDVENIHACFRKSKDLVDGWTVDCRGLFEDKRISLVTKRVVIAVGGFPRLPRSLHSFGPKIVHSSQYLKAIQQNDFRNGSLCKLAVIGGGQSAAEIFCDLMSRFPKSQVTLFTAGSALKPSDDSPFVNEIFNPDQVDEIYALEATERFKTIAENRPTNYSVVRPELLDRLYEQMYHQRLREPDKDKWPFQIQGSRELRDITQTDEGKVTLRFIAPKSSDSNVISESGFDLVFAGTGYTRDAHQQILEPISHLIQDSSSSVGRDYRLKLKPDVTTSNCGIWLQGCCEASHGLSDSLLSILAVRGGEIVDSMFRSGTGHVSVSNEAYGHSNLFHQT